ncbi:hypothetical protein TNCV_1966141 [Trichonephila clavipes]|nr:hypothetical protein TNCV_1966141 [Trichonephila clavipes]
MSEVVLEVNDTMNPATLSTNQLQAHEFIKLSPYPYTPISSIQLESRLVRPGNVFQVINSPMSVLTGSEEA